jgi:hypothetical protein
MLAISPYCGAAALLLGIRELGEPLGEVTLSDDPEQSGGRGDPPEAGGRPAGPVLLTGLQQLLDDLEERVRLERKREGEAVQPPQP